MSLAHNVDRAMKGQCIICGRRLPKARIALYHAYAHIWVRGGEDQDTTVEVCVCGDKCLQRYENGEVQP